MIEIVKITDYDTNLDLLINQFRSKTKFVSVLTSMNTQAEDLENALFEIRDNYYIDTAEGVQLDVLGDIQQENREGRSDANYRLAIQAKIAVNNAVGTFESIITALTALFGSTIVRLKNIGNANLYLWTDILITTNIYNSLLKIIPSGVQLYLVFSNVTNPFVFYGDSDGEGFGKIDTDPLTFSDGVSATFDDDEVIELLNTGAETDTGNGGQFQATIG